MESVYLVLRDMTLLTVVDSLSNAKASFYLSYDLEIEDLIWVGEGPQWVAHWQGMTFHIMKMPVEKEPNQSLLNLK